MAGVKWFKVATDFPDDPKARRLALRLRDPNAGMYVVRLWAYCGKHALSGRIQGGAEAVAILEEEMRWKRAPGRLVEALLLCGDQAIGEPGFLELQGGAYLVHGWEEWNGSAIRKALADNEKPRGNKPKSRENTPDIPPVSRGGPARDQRGTSSESPENTAMEIQMEKEKQKKATDPPLPPASGGPEVAQLQHPPASAPPAPSTAQDPDRAAASPVAPPASGVDQHLGAQLEPRRRLARIGLGHPAWEAWQHWSVGWKRLTSADPAPLETRHAQALGDLTERFKLPELCARMDTAMADPWWLDKLTLDSFLAHVDRFAQRAGRSAAPVKPLSDCAEWAGVLAQLRAQGTSRQSIAILANVRASADAGELVLQPPDASTGSMVSELFLGRIVALSKLPVKLLEAGGAP